MPFCRSPAVVVVSVTVQGMQKCKARARKTAVSGGGSSSVVQPARPSYESPQLPCYSVVLAD